MMLLFVSIFFSLSFLNYVGFEFLLDEMSINMNILGHVVRDCAISTTDNPIITGTILWQSDILILIGLK